MRSAQSVLYGIIAVGVRAVHADDLIQRIPVWSENPERSLSQILLEGGLISQRGDRVVNAIVQAAVDAHGGDLAETLLTFGGEGAVYETFAGRLTVDMANDRIQFAAGTGTKGEEFRGLVAEPPNRYETYAQHIEAPARVLLVHDHLLGRDVVMNEFDPTLVEGGGGQDEALDTFLDEVRHVRRLDHLSVESIYEIGRRDNGHLYYTMRLVKGDTLKMHLQQATTLSDRLGYVPRLLMACECLQHAVERGVCFNQLTSDDIVLGQGGETIVTNWRKAVLFDRKDAQAFEQAQSDQLAGLRAVLLELVTGGGADIHNPRSADASHKLLDMVQDAGVGKCTLPGFISQLKTFVSAPGKAKPRIRRPAPTPERVRRYQLAVLVLSVLLGVVIAASLALRNRGPAPDTVQTDRLLYDGDIQRAETAVDTGVLAKARTVLAATPEEYRQWEWGRLQYEVNLDAKTLRSHGGFVLSASFDPTGAYAVSGGTDELVRVWNVEAGWEMGQFKTIAATRSVVYSPDGRYVLAYGLEYPSFDVWDTKEQRLFTRITLPSRGGTDAAFAPSGDYVVAGSFDGNTYVYAFPSGNLLHTLTGNGERVRAVAVHPQSDRIATGHGDGTVFLWDSVTGNELGHYRAHEAFVTSLVFTRDGTGLISASADTTARVWDVNSFEERVRMTGHNAVVWQVAVAHDGLRAATASRDSTVLVWDIRTGEILNILRGHGGEANSVDFSPDDSRLLTAGDDGTLRLWALDQPAPEYLTLQAGAGPVRVLAFNPKNGFLATGGDAQEVVLWNMETRQPFARCSGRGAAISALAFSADGQFLAAGNRNGDVLVWQVEGPAAVKLMVEDAGADMGGVTSLSFRNGSPELAIGYGSTKYRLLNFESGVVRTPAGQTGDPMVPEVLALSFSPDGAEIATGLDEARLWNSRTLQVARLFAAQSWRVLCLDFSPTRPLLAAGSIDHRARIWDLESGRLLHVLEGHKSVINTIDFNQDSGRVLTSSDDGTARVWDVDTGRLLLTLDGHTAEVHGAAFSPDGRYVVTVGQDGRVLLWPAFPWKMDAYPGDDTMSFEERIERFKRSYWEQQREESSGPKSSP